MDLKSMYSIVLSDDLVREVDLLARARGTNRSGLINEILAEYFSLTTPERQIGDIFEYILGTTRADSSLQRVAPISGSMLHVKSVLRYKYSPTIRYSVELSADAEGYTGGVRVQSRTQRPALIELLDLFFVAWIRLERDCLQQQGTALPPRYETGDGRLWRPLRVQGRPDPQKLGESIGLYIKLLDKAMELFFLSRPETVTRTQQELIHLYSSYLNTSEVLF